MTTAASTQSNASTISWNAILAWAFISSLSCPLFKGVTTAITDGKTFIYLTYAATHLHVSGYDEAWPKKTKISKYLETRHFMKTWKKEKKFKKWNDSAIFPKKENKIRKATNSQRSETLTATLKVEDYLLPWGCAVELEGGVERWRSLHATSENFQLDRVVRSLSWFILKYGNFWGTLGVSGGCETGWREEESFCAFPSWDGGRWEKSPKDDTQ